ncbi:hypothetical protein MSAN_01983600 [Mycena sanguinolenta]|uniref:Uncharacterized protein n=1 Tax=Mycena sanguinolenta TaxID=230812 RepID=A0A8H7CMW3_9AGAR|nr:hypothetical protein MSAN_01983600 [Mycena sanguinolenta]
MPIRRFAIAAANGSADDFKHLIDLVVDDEATYNQCLPVFHANLDLKRIPDEENLETDALKCANLALDSLIGLECAPKSIWPDLWLSVWARLFFFVTYRECLLDPFARPFACIDLIGFVCTFKEHEAINAEINRTVGFRSLVTEAWTMIMKSEEKVAHFAFPDLCSVIRDITINTSQDFEEILDGAGGAANLAYCVLQSITLLVTQDSVNPFVTEENLILLVDILLFLENLRNDETIAPALMQKGGATIITLVATASYNYHCGPDRAAMQQKVALLSLSALGSFLSCHDAMRDALAIGLLHTVMYCATISHRETDPSAMRGLRQMLIWILPGSTVFATVFEELEKRLPSVSHITEIPEFQMCWMHDYWVKFMALANDRNVALNVNKSIIAVPIVRKPIGDLVVTERRANQ